MPDKTKRFLLFLIFRNKREIPYKNKKVGVIKSAKSRVVK